MVISRKGLKKKKKPLIIRNVTCILIKGAFMSEIEDFKYFEEHQLVSADFNTGILECKRVYPANTFINKNGKKVSRSGHIRYSKCSGYTNQDGYKRIKCNKSLRMMHRLIYWLYYHDLPTDKEIDHIDKNRANNAITNLRLATRSENCKGNQIGRAFKHLAEEQVHQLCRDIVSNQYNITQLAEKYNMSRCNVKAVIAGKRWKKISALYFNQSSETIEKQQ